jgi:hypothetical protein
MFDLNSFSVKLRAQDDHLCADMGRQGEAISESQYQAWEDIFQLVFIHFDNSYPREKISINIHGSVKRFVENDGVC